MAFNCASNRRILSSASRSSFLFSAAHLCASLAAGLSCTTAGFPGLFTSRTGLALGILLGGAGDRLDAKLAPRFDCKFADPACEVRLSIGLLTAGLPYPAREAGLAMPAAERREADEAVG